MFFKTLMNNIKRHYYDANYVLDYLAVISGQKCTLHCKNCCNFSPYHSTKLDFYDADKIIKDIENVTKRIKHINRMQVQGGDFLLHKNAKKILEYIKNNDKIHDCLLATNCVLIPTVEIIEILKNKKFIVRISSYGNTNETSKEKLEELLISNNIRYKFHHFAKKEDVWSDLGGIDTPKHTKKETEKNYQNCVFKKCLTLENGIIARCARATVAHYLQHFKLKKTDFVNVRKFTFSISELKKYVQKTAKTNNSACFRGGVMTACYYCNGTSGISIPAGEQLNIEELKEIRRKYNDR